MSAPVVLVLRALGLGDFVTGLPALALLRRAYPEYRIVLAAPRQLAPLVALCGLVDDRVQAHELEPIDDPPQQPELAIDLHGNGPLSRALLEPCRPGDLLAYAGGPVAWRHDEHEVQRWCRLLREGLPRPMGETPELGGLLPRPEVALPAGRTVLHCGAKAVSRRWPPGRFAEVATTLKAQGHAVVVTGGRDEAALARGIASAADVDALIEPSLLELAALIGSARLVISGDTGVAHLASVYRRASVVLFGPVAPARWGPPNHPRHQVLWHGDGTGDPHAATIDPALDRISVAEVCSAVARALSADGAATQPYVAARHIRTAGSPPRRQR